MKKMLRGIAFAVLLCLVSVTMTGCDAAQITQIFDIITKVIGAIQGAQDQGAVASDTVNVADNASDTANVANNASDTTKVTETIDTITKVVEGATTLFGTDKE